MLVWFITTRSTPYKPKHVEIAITALGVRRRGRRRGGRGRREGVGEEMAGKERK